MEHHRLLGMHVLVAFFAAFLGPAHAGLNYRSDQTPEGLRYVIVSGEFDYEDDLDEFAAVVRSHNPVAVGFNSPGGNVAKAIELGRLIRSYGLHTVQAKGPDCASACALAFMGGVTRYAEPGAIGVHKSSFSGAMPVSSEEAVSAVQQLTADIIGYMTEMDVDPALLRVSLQYDSDDIRYLSRSEMQQYRVVTSAFGTNPPSVARASNDWTVDDGCRLDGFGEAENSVSRRGRFCDSESDQGQCCHGNQAHDWVAKGASLRSQSDVPITRSHRRSHPAVG